MSKFRRSSGVVMPIFSIPSKYGIGTFGKEAYKFVDFLEKSGQKYWQILPLGHTGFGNSPYQCFSTVAGNPYFIDLDFLVEMGLLSKTDLIGLDLKDTSKVDYQYLEKTRLNILRIAYSNSSFLKADLKQFYSQNSDWVFDYAMFMALKNYFDQKPVWQWNDKAIIHREEKSFSHYRKLLNEDINFYIFIQYLFFKQWTALKAYANQKNILIIGDIPMYPSADSCDVWCNPKFFKVNADLKPDWIAGVPPDFYSENGQVWGNPVYDWDTLKIKDYSWWIWRIRHTLDISDIIRIDHFRAFQDYFQIPADENTAKNGIWLPGPRMDFFNVLHSKLGNVPFIAEDLGIIDDSVRELLAQTGFPGMAVMIFSFRANENNLHMPHNWKQNSVGYTSTHDSETVAQAIYELSDEDKAFALDYIYSNPKETISFSAIRTAFASPADIVMVTIADLLSLGKEGRINTPSTIGGNWEWRANPNCFSEELANRLYKLTKTYKRLF